MKAEDGLSSKDIAKAEAEEQAKDAAIKPMWEDGGGEPVTMKEMRALGRLERPFTGRVLEGLIIDVPTAYAHQCFVRDPEGSTFPAFFYIDDPRPEFTYRDILLGNVLKVRNPRLHLFMDGQIGLRIESEQRADIRIIRADRGPSTRMELANILKDLAVASWRHGQHIRAMDGKLATVRSKKQKRTARRERRAAVAAKAPSAPTVVEILDDEDVKAAAAPMPAAADGPVGAAADGGTDAAATAAGGSDAAGNDPAADETNAEDVAVTVAEDTTAAGGESKTNDDKGNDDDEDDDDDDDSEATPDDDDFDLREAEEMFNRRSSPDERYAAAVKRAYSYSDSALKQLRRLLSFRAPAEGGDDLYKVVSVPLTDEAMEAALRTATAVLLNTVLIAIDARDFSRAHSLVAEAERLAPAAPKVHFRRSQIYEREGRLPEAVAAADKARALAERESGAPDEGARARVAALKAMVADADKADKAVFKRVFARQATP